MLKVASFNISGGFYIGDESTEYLDREAVSSVDNKLLENIINYINEEDVDIICFQEIITTKKIQYIQTIIDSTELKYSEEFELSPCNIVKDTDCGLAILSKYPITESIKVKFTNPKLSKTTSSGNTYYTYDKGYLVSNININGENVKVLTHHGFPYRRFNSTPEDNKYIFEEFDKAICDLKPDVITGDFNADNFMTMMDKTNVEYIRTFNTVTTVDGKMFDDILVKKDVKYNTKMIKSVSDHYMVIVSLDI